jgi:membrane protein DedA with SNARE-associated domain
VLYPLAEGSATTGGLWAYVVVFVLVAIGWAGVPAIGGTVVAGASVLASQGQLNIAGVLAASILGAGVGGLAGYEVGARWGRAIMNHPGPALGRRQRALTAGEALYTKWGRLAVFFTPCMVSGIVKMKYSQFVIWNLLAGAVYVFSVGPAAYGAGKVTSERSLSESGPLIAGIAVGAAAFWLGRRYHRHRQARRAAAAPGHGMQTPRPAGADEESQPPR